ncbi:MAG: hypothetical protein ABIJ65_09525 [Chloroflexota bacterium]
MILDLFTFQGRRTLNENDQHLLKRVQNVLLGEWELSLSIPSTQAASVLHRMLDRCGTAGD